MSDLFRSPRRRIARAKEHLNALGAEIDASFKSEPWADVTEPDAKGTRYIHSLRLTKELPESLTDLTIETVEALRAALDHAGYVTATAAGVANPKSSYFPIADTADELENVITSMQAYPT